jgi:DNA-binding XRE family transcriptional regulator
MQRILVPASGLSSWQARLADPEKHWQRTFSAFETAVSWEKASRSPRGLPTEMTKVLDETSELRGAELLFAIPEHKVALPGGQRASQTDVWALLRGPTTAQISMAVEGKADESFGETVDVWSKDASAGKTERLRHVREVLQLPDSIPAGIRYQLLHRTASALMEARRFGAQHAVMMVQAFRPDCSSFEDYERFGTIMGVTVRKNEVVQVAGHAAPTLFMGWVDSAVATDSDIAAVTTKQ